MGIVGERGQTGKCRSEICDDGAVNAVSTVDECFGIGREGEACCLGDAGEELAWVST